MRDKTVGLSEILWEKDKNFGETYSNVLKTSQYVSPKFFGIYCGCSLITIATFSKNITINKTYATKLYFSNVL